MDNDECQTRLVHDAPTAVICHDAGGAEIISRHVRDFFPNHLISAHGPAAAVFAKVLGDTATTSAEAAIRASTQVIVGTGWQTNIESDALRAALSLGRPTVAVLDHWTDYESRFRRLDQTVLPDEIWVTDSHAKSLAEIAFPTTQIRLITNQYVAEFVATVARERPSDPIGTLLFLSENVTGFAQRTTGDDLALGFTQYNALDYVLANVETIDSRIDKVVVRPHPSEACEPYARYIQDGTVCISLSKDDLATDIARAQVVVGLGTMAMYLASECGVRTLDCMPPGARWEQSLPARFEHIRTRIN